ncbi:hypothetical protein APICC_03286 [Apis cerana cerana]|uniref:Uncharacterized protein n=1 Tax=Apis cerana cerana TaxID=94128 RepID=A0A2A3ECD8_APICC|nr:hypothetical protein APICC_03286 [Apis cerana cerana]
MLSSPGSGKKAQFVFYYRMPTRFKSGFLLSDLPPFSDWELFREIVERFPMFSDSRYAAAMFGFPRKELTTDAILIMREW